MNSVVKIVGKVVAAIAALLFVVWMSLQTPAAQTLLTRKVADMVTKDSGMHVSFSKIHFRPFNAIVLKDLAVLDDDAAVTEAGERLDTVLSVRYAVATFSLKGLLNKNGIHIHRATVRDAVLTVTDEERGSNIKRLAEAFRTDRERDGSFLLNADRANVRNLRVRRLNPASARPESPGRVDFKDLDIKIGELDIRKVDFRDGTFHARVNRFDASDKSGFSIDRFSADAEYADGVLTVSDLSLKEASSHLNIPMASIELPSAGDSLHSGIRGMKVSASVRDSRIDAGTLGWLVPGLQGKKAAVVLSEADLSGTLDDLTVSRIAFMEETSGASLALSGQVNGLGTPSESGMDITVDNLKLTSEGAGRLLGQFAPDLKVDISRFAKGEEISFSGTGRGKVDDFRIKGTLKADEGKAMTDIAIKGLTGGQPKSIKGSLSTERLDIGRLAGIDRIGECTAHGSVDAELLRKDTRVKVDSVVIESLDALGYEYSNIRGAGTFSDNAFDGRIICGDPNLNFLFQGIFTLSDKTQNGLYKFYANVGYADLHALHLDRKEVSKVSGQVNANYMTIGKKDLIGDLDVSNLVLEDEHSQYDIGDICIKSHSNQSIHRINIESGFLTGTYLGSKPVTSMLGDIQDLTVRRDLPSIYRQVQNKWKGDDYDLRINIHEASDLLSFFKPGLFIADSTRVSVSVGKEGDVTASVKSPRLALGKNYLRNFKLNMDNRGGSINGAASCSEISAAVLKLMNDTFTFFADEDKFSLGFNYDNRTELDNKGTLNLTGSLSREEGDVVTVHGLLLPSSIWYNGEQWDIPSSRFEASGKGIDLGAISARCAGQSIKLAGGYSFTDRDTLTVDMVRMDLGILNNSSRKDLGIAGTATGRIMLESPVKDNLGLTMDITASGTEFGNCPLGNLVIGSHMDGEGVLHMNLANDLYGTRNMDIKASYGTRTQDFTADADLNKLGTGYLTPVLQTVFNKFGGSIDGRIKVRGGRDGIHVSSSGCRFNDVLMKIAYTNVPYIFNGDFSIDDKGLYFDDVTVRDTHRGKGRVAGGLSWGGFKDIRMDTRIKIDQTEAFDLGENDNPIFYGNVNGTGSVNITGPVNSLLLDINVRTDGSGDIHIPLDNKSRVRKNELLTFKEEERKVVKEDPYEAMVSRMTTVRKKAHDLMLRIRVDADQATEAYVEIDRAAGDVLSGRGSGILDIDIQPNRNIFAINGDYRISEGTFRFNAMDIAKRNFTIADGSSVHFNGDIMDSDLDISGLYTTKASVASLIADTSSVSTRRTVNCGIGISGKMREPQLAFSIDIPDLDPSTRSRVESALNTDDKIQKQMIALLLSGSFMPDEQSGIVNNSALLYTNVAEIMAGQLNSILQKLEIPLDFGLNYQPTESGTNIFDVAMSTQLFNNRVLVNGAFGNREYSSSSGEDVAGDLDIEIKLDKTGLFRLNLFSHSADDYTNYLDNTQRSGVGMTFQKEFDDLRDFLRDMFTGRKKKEEMRKRRLEETADSPQEQPETTTIRITRE